MLTVISVVQSFKKTARSADHCLPLSASTFLRTSSAFLTALGKSEWMQTLQRARCLMRIVTHSDSGLPCAKISSSRATFSTRSAHSAGEMCFDLAGGISAPSGEYLRASEEVRG